MDKVPSIPMEERLASGFEPRDAAQPSAYGPGEKSGKW